MLGADVSRLLVELEALEELVESLGPLFLLHVHFASTFFDDSHDTGIVDDSVEVHSLGVDALHPLLVVGQIAHLNFQGECLEEKV